MLKNVLNQQINLGRISLILLFAGGLVFAGTYNGFVVETEAQASCCGSPETTTAQASCCGSMDTTTAQESGTEVSKFSNAAVGDCNCISAPNSACSYCKKPDECGGEMNSCSSDCAQDGSCENCNDSIDCGKGSDKCSDPAKCEPDEWTGRTE